MTWKSAVGLTLAPFVASLALVLALASIQQTRKGFLLGTLDYSLLNSSEINRQTLKVAAEIKGREIKTFPHRLR
jgi:hypothetical protein